MLAVAARNVIPTACARALSPYIVWVELPTAAPVMTLPAATLFPQALLPLYIFEPRYRQMLADALESHRMFVVAMQKPGCIREVPMNVAGLGLVRMSIQHPDGTSHVMLQGLTRVALGETLRYKPYRLQRITPLSSHPAPEPVIQSLLHQLRELVQRRLRMGLPLPPSALGADSDEWTLSNPCSKVMISVLESIMRLKNPEFVADLLSAALVRQPEQRQVLLERLNVGDRLRLLIEYLEQELTRHGDKPGGVA
ncbi:MAG: LON peptidase substrate-binding domain-containing protein [Verrucomicrobiota bacterium]|nr:LON peptidase substrate-binding domain-containing protein [Limisphaera sp.]MDW8381821.1 LON peptidase substrate-binding domain-containing protein [Verrucomicrobiota bacterium]